MDDVPSKSRSISSSSSSKYFIALNGFSGVFSAAPEYCIALDVTFASAPDASGADCTYTWNYICTSPLEKLFSFSVTEEILSDLGKNVDASLRKYTDRKFHSLEILEMMNG